MKKIPAAGAFANIAVTELCGPETGIIQFAHSALVSVRQIQVNADFLWAIGFLKNAKGFHEYILGFGTIMAWAFS